MDINNLPTPPDSTAASSAVASLPTPPDSTATTATASNLPAPLDSQAVISSRVASLPVPPDSTTSKVDQEIRNRSILNRPALVPERIQDEDLQQIASKHRVSPEDLRKVVPYFAGVPGDVHGSDVLKFIAGEAGESAGLGVPQKLYRTLQTPQMEDALDDLHKLIEGRKSYAQLAGEAVVPLTVGTGEVSGIASAARVGAGIGAVAGAAGSSRGEELKSAALGAGGGAVIGAAGHALVGSIVRRLGGVSAPEQEIMRARVLDVEQGVRSISDKTRESEDILHQIVLGEKDTPLSQEEANKIVEQQYTSDQLEGYYTPSSMEGEAVREDLGHTMQGPVSQDEINRRLALDVVDNRIQGFSEYLTGKKPEDTESAVESIQKYSERQADPDTMQHLQERYSNYVETEQASRWQQETNSQVRGEPGFLSKTLDKLSGAQWVARSIDDKFDVGAGRALQYMNTMLERRSYARNWTRSAVADTYKLATQHGIADEMREGGKVYAALDKGDTAGLSEGEQQVVGAVRNYFDGIRDFVNGVSKGRDPEVARMNIPALENYIPHVPKPTHEIIGIVENKLDTAYEELSDKLGRDITDLSQLTPKEFASASGELEDLTRAANWGTGDKTGASSGRDLENTLRDMIDSRQGQIALESRARAAMERTGEIPDFLLETNVFRIMDRYAHNTLNHLYLRGPLDSLNTVVTKLRTVGADPYADYLERMGQDTLGVRRGTAAEASMSLRIQMSRKLDKMVDQYGENSWQGSALSMAKYVPDILNGAMRNIYENALGFWNIHSAMMHSAVSFARLAPELGSQYGYYAVMRGAMRTATNFSEFFSRAQQMGNLPAEFIRSGEKAIQEGLFSGNGILGKTADAYKGLAHAGMILFRTGEHWNRSLVVGTADVMASDLVRGGAAARLAQNSLRKFPAWIQRDVAAAGTDTQAISNVIGKYLNDTTIFHYNRTSMFEYGRTLGKLFTTFSKWPTELFGEARYHVASQGLAAGGARVMDKLVTPFALLAGMQYMAFGSLDPRDMPDSFRKAIGSHGLQGLAPLGALREFAEGKTFTPPMVDAVMSGVVRPVLEGDMPRLERGLDSFLYSYAPGTGLLRFLTDDIVTYATGQRPEGKTFLGRTQSGLDQITNK